MEEYRAYVIGPDGHIVNRVDIRCFDEKEARRLAKIAVDGHAVEPSSPSSLPISFCGVGLGKRQAPSGDTPHLAQSRAISDASRQPGSPMPVEYLDLGPGQAWHVAFDAIADGFLCVCEMTIADRKSVELFGVQFQFDRRIDRIEPILFINRLPQDNAPDARTLFQKIVEASGTNDIARDVMHGGALRDRHLGLCDGTIAIEIDRGAAEEMEDADAFLPTFLADSGEIWRCAMEPGRAHPAIVVPDCPEPIPIPASRHMAQFSTRSRIVNRSIRVDSVMRLDPHNSPVLRCRRGRLTLTADISSRICGFDVREPECRLYPILICAAGVRSTPAATSVMISRSHASAGSM